MLRNTSIYVMVERVLYLRKSCLLEVYVLSKNAIKKKLETKHENVLGPFHVKSRERLKSTWPNISNALGQSNPRKCYILRLLKANKWRLFPSYLFSKHNIDLFLMKAFISYIMYIDSAHPWTGYCLVWIIGKLLLKL